MDSLNNDDGVVNHNGNSQQQCRQHKQVDREAHHLQEEERTDERDGHGNQRDKCRTEVLQEDVNHEEHQYERQNQREHHLLDRGIEEFRHVVVDFIHHSRREQFGLFFQFGLHILCDFVGVRAGNLLHHTHDRRSIVVLHRYRVLQTAQLYLGHIFQLQRLTVVGGLDDDIAKFLWRLQSARVTHGVFIGHVRLLTEGTRGRLDVLFGQHTADVSRHQVVLFHYLRFQPDTHGVGFHTWRRHIADALDTFQGRDDVDIGVVGEELVIIASVFGSEGIHDDLRCLPFHDLHTGSRHFCGQQRLCLRHTVLHVDGAHIGIDTLAEEYGDGS